ncbi:uncharacterized protein [Nicotiana tomentosiformis]|uniref:uncharacterized protein n=1 Tax=Nicotiana tomentosiformis TaxID=4098 RepID=UPI00388C985C
MVANTLRRKAESMGSLAFIPAGERSLSKDVQALANKFVRLDILEPIRVLACIVSQSSLLECIKYCQYDDPHLHVFKDTVLRGGAKEVSTGDDGVLRLEGWILVLYVDGLGEMILEKDHSTWYSIDLGVVKMKLLQNYFEDLSHMLDFSSLHLDVNLAYEKEPVAIFDRQPDAGQLNH